VGERVMLEAIGYMLLGAFFAMLPKVLVAWIDYLIYKYEKGNQ
jgi:hypothetical protein